MFGASAPLTVISIADCTAYVNTFPKKISKKKFQKSVDISRLCGIMYIVKGTLVADHTGRAETSKQQKILSALKR